MRQLTHLSLVSLLFSCLVLSLLSSSLLSFCLLPLSLSVSLSVSLCLSLSLSVSLCLSPCDVVCVFVCCGTLKRRGKNPCVHSKESPCMPAHRPHVFQHVYAWCRYTWRRKKRTHRSRVSSSVLLTKICPRVVITCFSSSPKNYSIFTIFKFE